MSKRPSVWKPIRLILVLILAWNAIGYSPSWWAMARARLDFARGDYHMTAYGLHARGFDSYQNLLLRRYGVHMDDGGCGYPGDASPQAAYDNVMSDCLIRKYHHDIFVECDAVVWPQHG
jgi:hypothetical protein